MTSEPKMVIKSSKLLRIGTGLCLYEIEIPLANNYTIIDSCHCWSVGDSLDFVKIDPKKL
jgi:hypothetical protein